ncbi:chitinase [Alternaria panax]|uniref:chitinase n=1 Tax=Alternaria panax TaxID=48097 RepID=A0AAD4IB09_9PLEO|nr:chitinase [Alternaria panax]
MSLNTATPAVSVENPKMADELFQSSLEVAPACARIGTMSQGELEMSTNSGSSGDAGKAVTLLEGMQTYFAADDNCDENFLFAYYNGTVAGMYMGAGLGKKSAETTLNVLSEQLRDNGFTGNQTVAQVCGNGRSSERILGIAIDHSNNLAAVQKAALDWSKGECSAQPGLEPVAAVPFSIMEMASSNATNATLSANWTISHRSTDVGSSHAIFSPNLLDKRATCRYIQVVSGDGCGTLVSRCGISSTDFTKFNPKPNLCSSLQAGDYVCCSAGDAYTKPTVPKPSPNADGTCATHLIADQDDCSKLSTRYGVTVDEIEKWNKGKTWAWTECKDMLLGYNLCVSDGKAPLPPPQAGTACGPLVPGTKPPASGQSLADLNPCPLNACCSNWGFCGVFPGHCDIHAPTGGGPGTKLKEFQNTCVSNCGNKIKQNSGPPAKYSRVGYYESYNFNRECLWLSSKNANTDGSYTHMHWGFADIDPNTWKPIITDPDKQWDDFKKLNLKRIVSFGGWAYSTEPATYNIIRRAIIDNRETFARNLAQFAKDEGIDGIDIDWEYPGAPDIMVDGSPIGKETDGQNYLRFLTVLKSYLGPDKSVSIAAPASFWYLKAFPIQKISAVIDYIVYMTYDLHGQWDYGNPNSFDQCDSGKCIRSHVNLTETTNALSMITKAGVENNKVFVGEASYGRSFHMASDGCWGPMCDFTGSRTHSDAKPGRCTASGGYLAYAEIAEIQRRGQGAQVFHDDDSSSDIMLYGGDYVSYMTPDKKEERRETWRGLNFAGTIDWAVDLQRFGDEDIDTPAERPESGEGCVGGEDISINTGDLCEFTCLFGFCPESLCHCSERGDLTPDQNVKEGDYRAIYAVDVDISRLCNFACKRDFCPSEICEMKPKIEFSEEELAEANDGDEVRRENDQNCAVWKNPVKRDASSMQCYDYCKDQVEAAKAEGRTTNYGCIGFWPGAKEVPWTKVPGTSDYVAGGRCSCDNWVLNEIVDTVLEAMPMIAQIGCYIIMQSIKTVLDVGLQFVPGVGKILDAGLDMATTAAQMAAYLYADEDKPADAFNWWLSPCGGTDLVPEEIKKAFEILSAVTDGVSSFKTPKNLKKGSGKKGDDGNPVDQSTPRAPKRTSGGNKKCSIPAAKQERRIGEGKNTIRKLSCDKNDKTQTNDEIVVSAVYAKNPTPHKVEVACPKSASQACYHYSSVIKANTDWSVLTCPPEAASTAWRQDGGATESWSSQHNGAGWQKNSYYKSMKDKSNGCERDEYPPAYLMNKQDPAWINGGKNMKGQVVRFLPRKENNAGGRLWKGMCFRPLMDQLTEAELKKAIADDKKKRVIVNTKGVTETHATMTLSKRPELHITSWPTPPAPPAGNPKWGDAGIAANPCWDQSRQAQDPGFALFTYDPWYQNNPGRYNYKAEYSKGPNGS